MVLTALLALAVTSTPQAVEVPFRVADRAIVVDAVVNGRKVSCMFDSGFSGAFVLRGNLNFGRPTGKVGIRDFVGQFEADMVPITSLKFGSLTLPPSDMEIIQQPVDHFTESYGQHVDGIMGLRPIAGHIVEVNFEHKKFVLHPPSLDISTRIADNKRTFLLKMLPKGHNAVHMLAKTKEGKSLTLALDTGNAFYLTTHKDVLERVGVWQEGKKPKFVTQSRVASGAVDSWAIKLENTTIFGVPVAESIWDVIDLPSSAAEHDGTVGFGFLQNFNFILDIGRRRVWMENFTGRVSEPEQGDVGLKAYFEPSVKRMRVWKVMPNSPAARAGIKENDDLLDVDGVDLVNVSVRRLTSMLRGEPGSKVTLALSRAGHLMRLEVQREALVN